MQRSRAFRTQAQSLRKANGRKLPTEQDVCQAPVKHDRHALVVSDLPRQQPRLELDAAVVAGPDCHLTQSLQFRATLSHGTATCRASQATAQFIEAHSEPCDSRPSTLIQV